MRSTSRAWSVAAAVGAVEALKDQGICRWNSPTIRAVYQHAKTNLNLRRQFSSSDGSKNKKLSSPSSGASSRQLREGNARRSSFESEPMRRVMYLSSWGPN